MFIVDRDTIFDFSVFSFLAVSASATDCVERLISKMTHIVSSGTLKTTTTITTFIQLTYLSELIWVKSGPHVRNFWNSSQNPFITVPINHQAPTDQTLSVC